MPVVAGLITSIDDSPSAPSVWCPVGLDGSEENVSFWRLDPDLDAFLVVEACREVGVGVEKSDPVSPSSPILGTVGLA